MRFVVYNRSFEEDELKAAKESFVVTDSRLDCHDGDVVIPRYSYLPYAKELEKDMRKLGATIINTYAEHRYVANLWNWYDDLKDYTFKSWHNLSQVPDNTPLFLKGTTNSKKFLWDTHCYAKDKVAAQQVLNNLLNDELVSEQGVVFREYELLHEVFLGLHGLPVTAEYRFFVYRGKVLSSGYYWSSHTEDVKERGYSSILDPKQVPSEFLNKVIALVGDKCPFYVLDVAQTANGTWKVVELNDGCMSGLSDNNPRTLYSELRTALDNFYDVDTHKEKDWFWLTDWGHK